MEGMSPTPFSGWGDWAAYALYFVVALFVFIRTDLTFVNPTLYILNHRVVSANAYLPEDRSLIPGSPFVIAGRDPRALASSEVNVTSIGGGFVSEDEPKVSRGVGSSARCCPGAEGIFGATGHEGR